MDNQNDKKFMRVEELAEILEISKSQAYKLIRSDSVGFKVLAIGTRLIIPVNSFNKWYDSLAEDQGEE